MKTKPEILKLLSSVTAISLLSLTGLTYADDLATVGSQWAVYMQNTLPNGNLHFYPAAHATTIPGGGVQFDMPDATDPSPTFVNYMLDTYTVALSESSTIAVTINVVASAAGTAFLGDTFGGSNPSPPPPSVRLFIQANLPSDGSAFCVGGNKNLNNYWWADINFYDFVAGGSGGPQTFVVSLDHANWSGICGNPASADKAAFDLAIANIKYVGLSFGSGYFFANGVGVDGNTGTATFQLLSYTITNP